MAEDYKLCHCGDCAVLCKGGCYGVVNADGTCIARCFDEQSPLSNRSQVKIKTSRNGPMRRRLGR